MCVCVFRVQGLGFRVRADQRGVFRGVRLREGLGLGNPKLSELGFEFLLLVI